MKSIKKLTALVLCASIIVFSVISAGAAGSYFLSEDFYYGVADNNAYVHGYQGTESDVVIREKFLSYYVTAVDSFAFFRNETIETLSLYDATMLTELGQCAFAECVNLKYVEIPSSVQTMGDSVFDSCASLDYVRFRSGSVTQIPSQAFYACSSLETVLFENSLTAIGTRAFYGCSALNEVELPETLASVGDYAFANCGSLEKVVVPSKVTDISDTAFEGSDNVTIYCLYDSSAYAFAKQKNIPYVLLDNVRLGDANGDDAVNINDVTALQRYLAELETLEGIYLYAADTNQDGFLDIADATHLQMYLAEYDILNPIGEIITQ